MKTSKIYGGGWTVVHDTTLPTGCVFQANTCAGGAVGETDPFFMNQWGTSTVNRAQDSRVWNTANAGVACSETNSCLTWGKRAWYTTHMPDAAGEENYWHTCVKCPGGRSTYRNSPKIINDCYQIYWYINNVGCTSGCQYWTGTTAVADAANYIEANDRCELQRDEVQKCIYEDDYHADSIPGGSWPNMICPSAGAAYPDPCSYGEWATEKRCDKGSCACGGCDPVYANSCYNYQYDRCVCGACGSTNPNGCHGARL